MELQISDSVMAQLRSGVYCLALSGGVDSMALAHSLIKNRITFVAAHVNYHLRGKASDQDEALVRRFAKQHHIRLFVLRIRHKNNTGKYANVQARARQIRYKWIKQLCKRHSLAGIVTAHHHNDNVETFFLQMLRGASLKGLKGMQEIKGRLIRPLIRLTRAEIETYAAHHQLAFANDASNFSEKYLRNKLRLSVLPEFQRAANKTMLLRPLQMAQLAADWQALQYLHNQLRQAFWQTESGWQFFDFKQLIQHPLHAQLPGILLRPYGFGPSVWREVVAHGLKANSDIPEWENKKYEMLLHRGKLWLRPKANTCLSPPSLAAFQFYLLDEQPKDLYSFSGNTALVDPHRLPQGIWEVGLAKPGEMFIPMGMKASKSIMRFLKDQGLHRWMKEKQPILRKGGKVVWLPGLRIDERFKVDESSHAWLKIAFNGL